MASFKEWPAVLQRRLVVSALLGLGFLLVGLAVFFSLQDRMLLIISGLLAVCTAWRCVSFYRTAAAGTYEVVDGVCIAVGRAGMRKQRSVRLLTLDGNEVSMMLDKRTPLRIGNRYRAYFRCGPGAADMPPLVQAHFSTAQFLALEDLGEYQAERAAEASGE